MWERSTPQVNSWKEARRIKKNRIKNSANQIWVQNERWNAVKQHLISHEHQQVSKCRKKNTYLFLSMAKTGFRWYHRSFAGIGRTTTFHLRSFQRDGHTRWNDGKNYIFLAWMCIRPTPVSSYRPPAAADTLWVRWGKYWKCQVWCSR